MKRVLHMKFLKSDGKKVTIQIDDIKEDVLEKDVNDLMDYILSKDLFTFKGASLSKKEAAEIVNISEEEISLT